MCRSQSFAHCLPRRLAKNPKSRKCCRGFGNDQTVVCNETNFWQQAILVVCTDDFQKMFVAKNAVFRANLHVNEQAQKWLPDKSWCHFGSVMRLCMWSLRFGRKIACPWQSCL